MVHIRRTPLSEIRRAAVYVNTDKLPLSRIVEEQKPDLAVTAGFYNGKWRPVCPVKADGRVLFRDERYDYWAVAWDTGPDARPLLVPKGAAGSAASYVANCVLITDGVPHETLYYNADVGGRRGRAAVGLTHGGEWLTFAAADGSGSAMTPEELRDYLAEGQGCAFAIMMDGGGKVNCYDRKAGVMMEGKDPSQTLILLWLNNEEKEDTPVSDIKTYSVKRDGKTKLGSNFQVREFACNDGSDAVKISDDLVEVLQQIRYHFGKAVVVTSGYRTPAYNAKIGGASRSRHVQGTAADIVVAGVEPLEVAQYAEFLMPDRGGVGVYQTFTHVDVRVNRSRWDNRSGKEVSVSGWPGYSEKSEAELAVEWITGKGIMKGDTDGDLMLDQPLTRGQFAVMLYRRAKLEGRV